MYRKIWLTILTVLLAFLASLVFSQIAPARRAQAAPGFTRFGFATESRDEAPTILRDAAGGMHVAFTAKSALVYYAYCPAQCNHPANWQYAAVGNHGASDAMVSLALDANGHPRLMWYYEENVLSDVIPHYAACETNCVNPSNWVVTSLTAFASGLGSNGSHKFSIDPQGRPRFLNLDYDGLEFVYCDTGCTNAANWSSTLIYADQVYQQDLVFASNGKAAAVFSDLSSNVYYAECNAACDRPENWAFNFVFTLGSSGEWYHLKLDAEGHPRLAFFTGTTGSEDTAEMLGYAWCDAACATDETSWDNTLVGLPAGHGQQVSLTLDTQGRPHLAYQVDVVGEINAIAYIHCTGNCQSASAVWGSETLVETTDEIDSSNPLPPFSGCSWSYWIEAGTKSSLVLDSAGNPWIAYGAEHYSGGSCTLKHDADMVRLAMPSNIQPPTPTATVPVTPNPGEQFPIFLPIVIRR